MKLTDHIKITNFFLTIAEWDRHVELTRQFLNSIQDFEPYAAFLRLSNTQKSSITAKDIFNFQRENNFKSSLKTIKSVIGLFDTKITNNLSFEDFLKMILSRDNPDLRFNAVSNPNYEVNFGEKLCEEIEYTLARFFSKACEFIEKVSHDSEITEVMRIGQKEGFDGLFSIIDSDNSGILDFGNLARFFGRSKIRLRDSEMIAILRVIDINDDGIIDEREFEYFTSLFRNKEPKKDLVLSIKSVNGRPGKSNKSEDYVIEDMEKREILR